MAADGPLMQQRLEGLEQQVAGLASLLWALQERQAEDDDRQGAALAQQGAALAQRVAPLEDAVAACIGQQRELIEAAGAATAAAARAAAAAATTAAAAGAPQAMGRDAAARDPDSSSSGGQLGPELESWLQATQQQQQLAESRVADQLAGHTRHVAGMLQAHEAAVQAAVEQQLGALRRRCEEQDARLAALAVAGAGAPLGGAVGTPQEAPPAAPASSTVAAMAGALVAGAAPAVECAQPAAGQEVQWQQPSPCSATAGEADAPAGDAGALHAQGSDASLRAHVRHVRSTVDGLSRELHAVRAALQLQQHAGAHGHPASAAGERDAGGAAAAVPGAAGCRTVDALPLQRTLPVLQSVPLAVRLQEAGGALVSPGGTSAAGKQPAGFGMAPAGGNAGAEGGAIVAGDLEEADQLVGLLMGL